MDTEKDLSTASRDELLAIIAQQRATIAELQHTIAQLQKCIEQLEGRLAGRNSPGMPGNGGDP